MITVNKNLSYHRRVARLLKEQPDCLIWVMAYLYDYKKSPGGRAAEDIAAAEAWLEELQKPLPVFLEFLVSHRGPGKSLRQNSPFPEFINEQGKWTFTEQNSANSC